MFVLARLYVLIYDVILGFNAEKRICKLSPFVFFATYAINHAVVVFVVDVVYTKYLISIKFIFNLIRFSLIFLVQFSSTAR